MSDLGSSAPDRKCHLEAVELVAEYAALPSGHGNGRAKCDKQPTAKCLMTGCWCCVAESAMNPITLCFSDEAKEQTYQIERFRDSYVLVVWFLGIFSVLNILRAFAFPAAYEGSLITR